ncbi:Kinesin-like protein KIN-8A [Camellia lanceoleosa]|uniref:Kinesin-like protein KIN-8A n=1 Tax=Camellia lanceoleosa TaxID=1840588 RepID=A0ACC0HYB5_9ERIC|nr:Kinesin-like protein KIN-8A [Camellia lanceoleosa]
MPVSTRSQITNPELDEQNQDSRTRLRTDQEETTHMGFPMRNPHHGLKEKMKALTLLYEQQKRASAALKSPRRSRRGPRIAGFRLIRVSTFSVPAREDREKRQ